VSPRSRSALSAAISTAVVFSLAGLFWRPWDVAIVGGVTAGIVTGGIVYFGSPLFEMPDQRKG
jgi:hypothetical protein